MCMRFTAPTGRRPMAGTMWTRRAFSVERHDRSSRAVRTDGVRLPAEYVADHVQPGYASTIHGAQGATVDTTHTVLTGAESRQVLYAALARDGRAQSAATVEHGDAAQLLRQAALAYQDALPVLAQQHPGPEQMADLDSALENWMPGLNGQPAHPLLRAKIALRWVEGDAPQTVLDQATWYQGKQSVVEADEGRSGGARRSVHHTQGADVRIVVRAVSDRDAAVAGHRLPGAGCGPLPGSADGSGRALATDSRVVQSNVP